jgi:hypothetical protein
MINKINTALRIFNTNGFVTFLNYFFVKLKLPFHFNETRKSEVLDFAKMCKIYDTGLDLLRIGPKSDGGYLVPNILKEIEYCYSPGVGLSTKFEDHLLFDYNIKSFTADGTIKNPNSKHIFLEKNIGIESDDKEITLKSWIESNTPNNKNLILQMDIEGQELEVLLSTHSDILALFKIMIIEFHDFIEIRTKLGLRLYKALFEKLLKTHTIYHIHPNNMQGQILIKGIYFPKIIEIGFVKSTLIKQKRNLNYKLPHKLDVKNYQANPEIYLDKIFYN